MRIALLACLATTAIAAPALAQREPIDPRKAIYELRIYYPAPGKLDALNARFRDHTLKLFEKHGMRNVAYWNEQPTREAPDGRVIYILAYPSRAARDADWKAFGADPAWHPGGRHVGGWRKAGEQGRQRFHVDDRLFAAAGPEAATIAVDWFRRHNAETTTC